MTVNAALLMSGCALAVSLAAFALAVLVMRQSGQTMTAFRRHQNAHLRALGAPDPERRKRDEGPPPGTPNRRHPEPVQHRGAHAAPDTAQLPALMPRTGPPQGSGESRPYAPPPVPPRELHP